MKLKYYLRGLGIGVAVTAIIMSFTRQPEKLTDAQIKMRALELGMVEESVLADLQEEKELVSNENVSEEEYFQEEMPSENVVEGETEDVNSSESAETEEDSATDADSEEESAEVEEDSIEESSTAEEDSIEESSMEEEPVDSSNTEESSSIDSKENSSENVAVDSNNEAIEENTNNSSTIIPEGEVVENYVVISVEKGNGSEIVSRRLYEAGLVNSPVEYNQFLVRNGYDRKLMVGNHEIPTGATEEEMARILCGMK